MENICCASQYIATSQSGWTRPTCQLLPTLVYIIIHRYFHQSQSFSFFSGFPKALLYAFTSYALANSHNIFVKAHLITAYSGTPIESFFEQAVDVNVKLSKIYNGGNLSFRLLP
jgi:hypothetical protein